MPRVTHARDDHDLTPAYGPVEKLVRRAYGALVRPLLRSPMAQQRLRLAWFGWGYAPILGIRALPLGERVRLLRRFLRVDWNVPHAHKPFEIACIARVLAERTAQPGEVMVEAGCWQGGSSAKFSILCRTFGYRLRVYDSFQGVEPMDADARGKGHDFSGQYAAGQTLVRSHVERYGEPDVCSLHAGWFVDTLAAHPLDEPVRVAYIDCDLVKGTREVLEGVMPGLADDGVVFSQDYHIASVREMLSDPATWRPFGAKEPQVRWERYNLASLRFGGRERGGHAIEHPAAPRGTRPS